MHLCITNKQCIQLTGWEPGTGNIHVSVPGGYKGTVYCVLCTVSRVPAYYLFNIWPSLSTRAVVSLASLTISNTVSSPAIVPITPVS